MAQIAKRANVPVIMDAGGAEGPIPEELLKCITVLSPNETELARLTAMPTNSLEEIVKAATRVQEMVNSLAIHYICCITMHLFDGKMIFM